MNRPSKQNYHSFLKHTNNGINKCGEKTTSHVKHPDLFRLILSERAWQLLEHFRCIKYVCMETYKILFDIHFNLSLLCRLVSVWFLKCDSGTWKTRKWNTASRMLCTSFTTTRQAWPETTPRSLGKVPSLPERSLNCVFMAFCHLIIKLCMLLLQMKLLFLFCCQISPTPLYYNI